jgi:hypothetical protein
MAAPGHFGAPNPDVWGEIDIGDIAPLDPEALILNPRLLRGAGAMAGRALVYARAGRSNRYDAIGFRLSAAIPHTGPAPLQTVAMSVMQRASADRRRRNHVVDEILQQQTSLQHRPIALPKGITRYRYTIDRDTIHLTATRNDDEGEEVEENWTYALTDAPEMLQTGAVDQDEGLILAQQLHISLDATHWLPLRLLIEDGCFRRFQDARSAVVRGTQPGAFYCFLSHRWLSPSHPDPDAIQARFAAWQLVAHLAEAVRVADQRGLHRSRRFSPHIGTPIGPRGAELAEALIVNVLRFVLNDDDLRVAADEARSIELALDCYGVTQATGDIGLAALKTLLADRPVLRRLIDRVFVWYDYSCLPQPPREPEDVPLFKAGLQQLSAAQIVGRTAIMLDDADDYVSRAWCTLEALQADNVSNTVDLIVGSARRTAPKGEVEFFFEALMQDRPHIVWRAVLDTEVFRIQPRDVTMARLGLNVTDRDDLPFIYQRLSSLQAPVRTHADDSEILTGVFPLVSLRNRNGIIRARSAGRTLTSGGAATESATLDWTGALSLASAWDPATASAADVPPFLEWPRISSDRRPSCHVAIVAACEGEAILFARWVIDHRGELEAQVDASVVSVSWLASDIAPVGHMICGNLTPRAIAADVWAVVASWARLHHCQAISSILQTLRCAGIDHVTVTLDQERDNLAKPALEEPPKGMPRGELVETVDLDERPLRTHAGGLFRWQLQEALL